MYVTMYINNTFFPYHIVAADEERHRKKVNMKRKLFRKHMTVSTGTIHVEDMTPEQLYRALHTGFAKIAMPSAHSSEKKAA